MVFSRAPQQLDEAQQGAEDANLDKKAQVVRLQIAKAEIDKLHTDIAGHDRQRTMDDHTATGIQQQISTVALQVRVM